MTSRRTEIGDTLKRFGPPVLALAGLAIAQPLLDLFGRNPEFFVASGMGGAEIAVFGLVVVFLVPVVALAIVLLASLIGGRRAGAVAGHLALGLLAFALGLTFARQLGADRTVSAVGIAVLVTAAVLALFGRFAGFRQAMRYLALAPLAFLALFLFASESAELLFEQDADLIADVTVGDPAPVVVIVLDELPTASLLRPDGTIDATRFPGFARLADSSTWYRNAITASPSTPTAVPAVLDGRNPEDDALPTSSDHPDNLFTILGERYDLDVTESVTRLCPSSVCQPSEDEPDRGGYDRLRQAVDDAAVVYGHASLPRRFRVDLPAVDRTWGGFIDEANLQDGPAATSVAPEDQVVPGETPAEFIARMRADGDLDAGPSAKGETLRGAIAASSIEGDDDLLFVHEVFPHSPWVRTPTGAAYADRAGFPGQVDNRWGRNEFLIAQALQRHLLQTGYADLIIGELIDDLEANGTWQDAMVVVTADHGASFQSGESPRSPAVATAHEILNVPLFVKYPGQESGEVDDRPAATIDILPTVVDVLDVQGVDLDLDGTSLAGEPPPEPFEKAMPDGPAVVFDDIEGLLEVAEANEARFRAGQGWASVFGPGPYGELVGRELSEFDVGTTERRWSAEQAGTLFDLDLGTGVVPLILTGEMDAVDDEPDALLIGLNGTIAGVVGFERTAGEDAVTWSALLDDSLFVDGTNTLELLSVSGPVEEPVIASAGPPT